MATQGPIQRSVRARIAPGATLRTAARRAPFVVKRIDGNGMVLLLGATSISTPFDWDCIEGIGRFLRGKGWVDVGSRYGPAEKGTLHDYMLGCINRATANWVAKVLEEAGVVELDGGRPLRVRLRAGF